MRNINTIDNYQKEIEKRAFILNKVRNKTKISPDERLWLMTHSVYNQKLGNDAFNISVEHIKPNEWFLVKVRVESVSHDGRIIPILSAVPAKKGQIVADFGMCNYNGELIENKTIKAIGFELRDIDFEYEVRFFSDLGLISVQYECDYFDLKQKLNKREASGSGNPDFAMKRQEIDQNTVRYYCKSPNANSFDALIFTVHWEEFIEKK